MSSRAGGPAAVRWARCGFLAALVGVWLSAGVAPLRDAVSEARAPSDFGTDFVPAARVVRRGSPAASQSPWSSPFLPTTQPRNGIVDVTTGNAEAARFGAPPYADVGVPFGAHPPPAVLVVATLVPLGFANAAVAWLLLSLAGLATVAWVAALALGRDVTSRAWWAAGLFAALTLWPPVLHNIEKGQWSLIIAGLLAAAWWARSRGRDRTAGALVAIAASFKIMPLLAVCAFLGGTALRRRRVIAGAAGALAAIACTSLLLMGPRAWTDFIFAAPINTRGWQTGPANTLSLWGALARLLVGGPYAQALAMFRSRPALGLLLARAIWIGAAGALLVVVVRVTRRGSPGAPEQPATAREHSVAPHDATAFAAWCGLTVVLGPLSWSHAAVFLVLPIALLAQASGELTCHHRATRLLLAVALVMLTIPRLTLFRGAGPFPVQPAGGLLLAVHLLGAGAVIAAATVLARTGDAAQDARRNQPGGVA